MSDWKKNKPVVNEFQPSMTEWFAQIGEAGEANALREEDNRKVERLEILYQTIGLQYERPVEFSARELWDKTPEFAKFLEERAGELCAIRLVPRRDDLPKLRNRGLSIHECYETWFLKQDINPDDYRAFVCPHTDELVWSAIFVVKPDIIFGEIVRGLHTQLTHGNNSAPVSRFRFDFKDWQWGGNDREAQEVAQKMVEMIHVVDSTKQKVLQEKLNAQFSRDYIVGYFEAVVWPDDKIYFIDYNRLLNDHITTLPVFGKSSGVTAYPGVARGRAVFVNADDIKNIQFAEGDILLTENTDVRFIDLMKKAGAIVTARGGILSHASIVARELKKPCIVGAAEVVTNLKTGDMVEVDANNCVVRLV